MPTPDKINPNIIQKLRYFQEILKVNIDTSEEFDLALLNYSTYYTFTPEKGEFSIAFDSPKGMFYLDKLKKMRVEDSIAVAIRFEINGVKYPILIAYLSDDNIVSNQLLVDAKLFKVHRPTLDKLGFEDEEINAINQELSAYTIGDKVKFMTVELEARFDRVNIVPQQFICGIVNITAFEKIIKDKIDYYLIRPEKIREQDIMFKYLNKSVINRGTPITKMFPIQANMNEDQMNAVAHFQDCKIQTLNGPPGTGKSQTITEFILQCIINNNRVLLTSYNNKPVDVVYRKIQQVLGVDIPLPIFSSNIQALFAEYSIYIRSLQRITNEKQLKLKVRELEDSYDEMLEKLKASKKPTSRALTSYSHLAKELIISRLNLQLVTIYERDLEVLEDASQNKTRIYQARKVLEDIIDESPIVFSNILKGINNLANIKNSFEYMIVDEASQCNSVSIVPLLYYTRNLVVVGDPNQLRFIPGSGINKETHKGVVKLFEDKKLYNDFTYLEQSLFDYTNQIRMEADQPELFLSYHYRCHPDIIEFSNVHYYNSRLKIESQDLVGGVNWHNISGHTNSNNTNEIEVSAVIARVFHYLKSYKANEIGIISQYRNQVNRIRKALYEANIKDVQVGTIHTYQGDERKVILYSPVYSNDANPSTLRFINIDQVNILNVAISRGQEVFEVVGDRDYMLNKVPKNTLLNDLALHITSKNSNKM